MITTCTKCHQAYYEPSQEEADSPNRVCLKCFVEWPSVGCVCQLDQCICPPMEAALRAWINGYSVPMTHAQREVCLRELDSIEGYNRAQHESLPDSDLARNTLHAWKDYCVDKGLL